MKVGGVKESSPTIVHSRKLTWKPKKGPIKTTVLLTRYYMGFHVSLGECRIYNRDSLAHPALSHLLSLPELSRTRVSGQGLGFRGLGFRGLG